MFFSFIFKMLHVHHEFIKYISIFFFFFLSMYVSTPSFTFEEKVNFLLAFCERQ